MLNVLFGQELANRDEGFRGETSLVRAVSALPYILSFACLPSAQAVRLERLSVEDIQDAEAAGRLPPAMLLQVSCLIRGVKLLLTYLCHVCAGLQTPCNIRLKSFFFQVFRPASVSPFS